MESAASHGVLHRQEQPTVFLLNHIGGDGIGDWTCTRRVIEVCYHRIEAD